MSDDIDDELDRLRQLLQAVVRDSGLSVRALERKLGIKGGSTRKILKGEITLSVRHVLLILRALEMPYTSFFRTAYALPGDPGLPTETSMEDALGRLLVKALRKQVLETDGQED